MMGRPCRSCPCTYIFPVQPIISTSLAVIASGLKSFRHAIVAVIMLSALFGSWLRAREYRLM
jgi:hypothetical protein